LKLWRRWTQEEIAALEQMYTNERVSQEEIEQFFDRRWGAIESKAFSLNLRRPHPSAYHTRQDYFREITTQQQAYFLGLLAADGTITNKDGNYRVDLGLQQQDKALVESFRDALAPGAPIVKNRGCFHVRVGSKEMVNDLARFGIVPRKTYHFDWPQTLPDVFAIPFILGYFDGDGCLSQCTTRRNTNTGNGVFLAVRTF
jgi:hypothetical protein